MKRAWVIYIYIHIDMTFINWPSFATQQRKVPARFQDYSGFAGRALVPGPGDLNPTDSLLEKSVYIYIYVCVGR